LVAARPSCGPERHQADRSFRIIATEWERLNVGRFEPKFSIRSGTYMFAVACDAGAFVNSAMLLLLHNLRAPLLVSS